MRRPEKIYPVKRCSNCSKMYRQTRPNKKFCSKECKDEFNRYGAAFGPLKLKLEQLVNRWIKDYADKINARLEALEARVDQIEAERS